VSQGDPPRGSTPSPGPSRPETAPAAAPGARAADRDVDGRRDELALSAEPPDAGVDEENGEGPENDEGYAALGPGPEPAEEGYRPAGFDLAGYSTEDAWDPLAGYEGAEGYEPEGEYQDLGPEGAGGEGYEETEGYEAEGEYEETEGYEPEGDYKAEGEYATSYDEEGAGPGTEDLGAPPVVLGRRRHRVLKVVGALVVVLFVAGLLGFVHISNEVNPPGKPGRTVTVVVPPGASTMQIADLLAKAGVIHGPTVFEVYLKIEAAGSLLPGTYHLATNEPYSKAAAALENGPVLVVEPLVVPEGYTIRQMAAVLGRLPGIGVSSAGFETAATSGQVRSPYEPATTNNLEGLLFPATYPVRQGEPPDDLVQYMVDTFDSHAAQLGLAAAAKRLHYSPYQIVTVASIVEREAKLEVDRGPIASIIYNRLARGMPIGAESTLLYALGDPRGNVDITQPNPYNTLVNKGLPPTPIANPGIPSLKAAIDPPHTSYLYWVEINPDGKMGYASTTAGFHQLQRECRVVHLC
jgi:UPF0755 protein